MTFETVTLPADTWTKIVRRLATQVGADGESYLWADAIAKQTLGGSVVLKGCKDGNMRRDAERLRVLRESLLS